MVKKIEKTDEEWRKVLTPLQFEVTRKQATEPPFSGEYNKFDEDGVYHCVACDTALFESETKYDSGSGWPSFWKAIDEGNIKKIEDRSHGMVRTEIRCGACGSHLGHLFNDGPQPTGLRYCVNSNSLDFNQAEK